MRNVRKLLNKAPLYLAVIFIALWTLVPYVWLIISSLSIKVELLAKPLRWFPSNR